MMWQKLTFVYILFIRLETIQTPIVEFGLRNGAVRHGNLVVPLAEQELQHKRSLEIAQETDRGRGIFGDDGYSSL